MLAMNEFNVDSSCSEVFGGGKKCRVNHKTTSSIECCILFYKFGRVCSLFDAINPTMIGLILKKNLLGVGGGGKLVYL